jgi:golgin subfamily A protein 1
MNEKLKQNEDFHFELIKLSSKLEEYEFELDNQKSIVLNQETEITILKSEKNDLIVKNGELAKKLEILNKTPSTKSTNEEPNQNTNSLNISEFTARIEQVTSLKDTEEFKILQDQINEKNKTIKNLQQRLNDMKKTFQKEFKFQSSANNNESTTSVSESKNNKTSQIEVNNNNSSAAKLNATKKQTYLFKSISMSNNAAETIFSTQSALATPHKDMTQLSHLHDDVNFKYLKHVVLKFLTSRSYEAFHLVKALSVLLNFTNEEEQILKDTLQWKMSWFGSRPKV